jgi:hypothetical protein
MVQTSPLTLILHSFRSLSWHRAPDDYWPVGSEVRFRVLPNLSFVRSLPFARRLDAEYEVPHAMSGLYIDRMYCQHALREVVCQTVAM